MLRRFLTSIALISLFAGAAEAFDTVGFSLDGGDEKLREKLIAASLVVQAARDDMSDPQEILATARSDYARMVSVFYDNGYFGPTVSIRADGVEVGEISPLVVPETVTQIDMRLTAGPLYRFDELAIGPRAAGTELPQGFASGQVAQTAVIAQSARRTVRGWQDIGHAKADIADQNILADHNANTVSAELMVEPGPKLRFGTLTIIGNEDVSTRRIDEISGFPSGETFSPDAVNDVSENLRRTGAFRSAVLVEAETPNPDGTLDMTVTVSEQLPRRFGFGAEYSNLDGIELQGFWMHRNLLGGAERLELDATITGIASEFRDPGLEFGARFTRPATPRSDTDFFLAANLGLLDERDYSGESLKFGFGWVRRFNDRLTGELGVAANISRIKDDFGETNYRLISVPGRLTYDKRNDFIAPTNGFYIDTTLEPFISLKGSENGARFYGDLRGYEDFFEGDKLVVAGRLQLGSIVGPDLLETPNYMLFYSGGGGTVRGQEYESLGVTLPGGRTGGRTFVGTSLELRNRVSEKIEIVGFYDWGYIGAESFYDGSGTSHAGAGLGVRYITPIGPLRVDIATPVSGPETDAKALLYIGIGQAF